MRKLKNGFKELQQSYSKLSKEEKRVIQFCSIINESMTTTSLIYSYNRWASKTSKGIATTFEGVAACLKSLINKEFIIFDNGLLCNELFKNEATLLATKDNVLRSMATTIENHFPIDKSCTDSEKFIRNVRNLRNLLYDGDYSRFRYKVESLTESETKQSIVNLLNQLFNSPFNPTWFQTLPYIEQIFVLEHIFLESIYSIDDTSDDSAVADYIINNIDNLEQFRFKNGLIEKCILQGKFDDAKKLIEKSSNAINSLLYKGWLDFLNGNNSEAVLNFSKLLKILKREKTFQYDYFDCGSGFVALYALLSIENNSWFTVCSDAIDYIYHCTTSKRLIHNYLKLLSDFKEHGKSYTPKLSKDNIFTVLENANALEILICSFIVMEIAPQNLETFKGLIITFYKKAVENKYEWLAMEFACLLSRLVPGAKRYIDHVKEIENKIGVKSVTSTIKSVEPWERLLDSLANFKTVNHTATERTTSTRLAWFFDSECFHIYPREQTINAKGKWSARGRTVNLVRIKNEELDCMTLQDIEIAKCIESLHPHSYGFTSTTSYSLDYDKAHLALVGHPLIFLDDAPTVNVELIKGNLELLIERINNEFVIKFSVDFTKPGAVIMQESETVFKVIPITKEHYRLKNLIGEQSLGIPAEEEPKILKAIKKLAPVITIHSDLEGHMDDMPVIEVDPRIHVQLTPVSAGLLFKMVVKPFEDSGFHFIPGKGSANIYTVIKGENVRTNRDINKERKNAFDVINSCSVLKEVSLPEEKSHFNEPEDCLLLLAELKALGDKIVVEWPKGGELNVSKPLSFENLRLSISKENDWFDVSGELKIDESLTLDIQKLIELVKNAPTEFIELGKGKFLTLAKQFKKRLEEMGAVSDKSKKGVKFHSIASLFVQEFVGNVKELTVDKSWKAQVKRLNEINDFQPKLPTTLQAELRSYQIDGFNWLSRLAHWGVGACLADDMGLGKTLQALALILERAKNGPTLAVAPASVCFNWIQEAERFAPTLNVQFFGVTDRAKTLKSLKGFDLLVCTYGLLQSEIKMIKKVRWNTIILDEAQAIKNTSTKRSKAAMELQGDFKMLTTGTPIENHLGELWNLFQFINPGLLGSLERFSKVFADPIEKRGDNNTKMRLRRLIHPFILRRTKSQVLEELPEKTEITLSVELTVQEASFYEALRLSAVQLLEEKAEDGTQKIFTILAEITKLRRACCHPSLVLPGCEVESSKLALFTEIVKDLMDNKHKALVFSQFVGHLNIIREEVERLGISYQYLDGSTPLKERKKRVETFQNGEGDLFLISLKAGGVGLNLTAADYVIHMDPWWNPAVEDQASDRAHRIGQQRPVTVYRLVTKGTIEEKIVKLHSVKRNLADSLLEGTETSAKISAEQLLQLIREN